MEWNKNVFGHIRKRKRELMARINGIQRAQERGANFFLHKLELRLQSELAQTLKQEEILWYQKSRGEWLTNGDKNTRYYHIKTIIWRNRNKVNTLRRVDGNWVSKREEVQNLITEYFRNLFKEEVMEGESSPISISCLTLTAE